jgi:hypothetical protein
MRLLALTVVPQATKINFRGVIEIVGEGRLTFHEFSNLSIICHWNSFLRRSGFGGYDHLDADEFRLCQAYRLG